MSKNIINVTVGLVSKGKDQTDLYAFKTIDVCGGMWHSGFCEVAKYSATVWALVHALRLIPTPTQPTKITIMGRENLRLIFAARAMDMDEYNGGSALLAQLGRLRIYELETRIIFHEEKASERFIQGIISDMCRKSTSGSVVVADQLRPRVQGEAIVP